MAGNTAHSTSAAPWQSSASAIVLYGSTATGSPVSSPSRPGAPGDRRAADGALPARRPGGLARGDRRGWPRGKALSCTMAYKFVTRDSLTGVRTCRPCSATQRYTQPLPTERQRGCERGISTRAGGDAPTKAEPKQDDGEAEEDRRLVPLESPVAAARLIRHRVVVPGGNLRYVVIEHRLVGRAVARSRPCRPWGNLRWRDDIRAELGDELGCGSMT